LEFQQVEKESIGKGVAGVQELQELQEETTNCSLSGTR
jgi:hypothetical protein